MQIAHLFLLCLILSASLNFLSKNSALVTNPPEGPTEWRIVLEVSRRWQSLHLRTTALQHLTKLETNPSERLNLAVTYEIDEWMPTILRDLVIQRALIAPSDLMLIPPQLLVGFIHSRERWRADFLADVHSRTCQSSNRVSHHSSISAVKGLANECAWRPENHRLLGQIASDALDAKIVSMKQRTVLDRFAHRKNRLAICDACKKSDDQKIKEWKQAALLVVNQFCFEQPSSKPPTSGPRTMRPRLSVESSFGESSTSLVSYDSETLMS
jgi:hypothetical protein